MSSRIARDLPQWLLHAAAITSIALVVACKPGLPASDNSGTNARDQQMPSVTPDDQSQTPADVALAAALRTALLELPDLSVNGQNIKIITGNGRVTLRGPVASKAERARIEGALAAAATGIAIDSQLELDPAN